MGRHRDRELDRRLDRGRAGLAGQPRVSGAILLDAVGIEVEGHPVTDIAGLSPQEVMALSFHDPGRFAPDADAPGPTPDMVQANTAALTAYGSRSMTDPTLLGRLGELDLPVQVIWGEADRIVTPTTGVPTPRPCPWPASPSCPAPVTCPRWKRPRNCSGSSGTWARPSHHADRSLTMTGLHATRIGHSCHLLEIDGLRLLTDPWFTVTPTYDPGEPVSLSVEQLPGLDGVIITHEHYDHCDLDALAGYRDTGVPVMVPQTVAAQAKDHGFTDVRVLEPWQHTEIGGVTVTAAPGKHGVPEITYVLQARGRTVYFGGDTLAIPELRELPGRFGHFDLALLPTNGLCIRPMNGQQVVMNATPAGVISTVAGVVRANGNPASGAENSGAAATASHLSAPESVAVDRSSGTLYIADTNNSAVAAVIGVAKAGASAAGPGARRRSPDARLRDNEETNGEQ